MKIEDLDFDTPSNACLSLRIISEKVRAGEWICTKEPPSGVLRAGGDHPAGFIALQIESYKTARIFLPTGIMSL